MSQSSAELTARLTTLHDSLKQTLQLIQRLAKLQHSPSDTTAPIETPTTTTDIHADDTPADLAAEIHESLKQLENDLELLKLEVEDVVVPAPSAAKRRRLSMDVDGVGLGARCARLEEDLVLARTRFRKAQLQAKHNADYAVQAERAAYLASLKAAAQSIAHQQAAAQASTESHPALSHAEMRNSLFAARRGPARSNTPNNATKDDMLLTSASDLTTSLRRTHALLSSSLAQSRFAHETLESSNAALQELNTRYGALDDLLSRSKGLLGTLLRSTKSDTWYLQTSLYLLIGTIGWLLFRRLLYGPLWWFLWLPIKLGFRITTYIVGGVFGLVVGDGTFSSAGDGSGVGKYAPELLEMQSIANHTTMLHTSAVSMLQIHATPSSSMQQDQSNGNSMSSLVARMAEASEAMHDFTSIATETALEPEATGSGEQAAAEQQGQEQPEAVRGQEQQQQQQQRQQQQGQGQGHAEVRRADGTVLRERDEAAEPRNPKKRMWEEPPAVQQQQGHQQREL